MKKKPEITSTKKIAVVTGGAKRIGKAITIALHQQGYDIVIQYLNSDKQAKALCAQLNKKRAHSATSFQCELDNETSLNNFIRFISNNYSHIGLLVNNASSFFPTPVQKASTTQWHKLMDSNVKAPYFLSIGLLKLLKKSRGNIINIVDIYGERPLDEYSIYSISKAALVMQTKSLAKELGPLVRVNGIAPGAILWPENKDNKVSALLGKTALKRKGDEKDIVDALLYLNSAVYVTGQIISVDGGRILNI
jgi:pteridine reductase